MKKKLQNLINKSVISGLVLFLVLSFSLGGCKKIKEEKRTKELAELSEITLVLDWTANTNHTGLFVAQEKGYFKEEGLDVTIVMPPEDGATSMVAEGTADIGIAFQNQLAEDFAANTELPVTAIATVYQHNQDGLLSLQSKDISTPVNLMDQSYATAEDVIEHSIVRSVVEMDGGDFSRVELVPSYVADALETLNGTGIGAVWGTYGWEGLSCVLNGYSVNFIAFADRYSDFDYYNVLLIANNDFLKKQTEQAKAFIKAVSRGYEFAVLNPNEAAEILLKENPDLDAKLVKASQEYVSGQYFAESKQFGVIDAGRWNRFFAWINGKQLFKNQIPENIGFSNDYLASPSTDLPSPTSTDSVGLYSPSEEGSDINGSTSSPEEGNDNATGQENSGNNISGSSSSNQNSNTGGASSFRENQSGYDVDDDAWKPNGY